MRADEPALQQPFAQIDDTLYANGPSTLVGRSGVETLRFQASQSPSVAAILRHTGFCQTKC
jgi:hypothetical protein